MQEVQERLAEASPLYPAARAVALEHERASQHAYRRRVAEAEAAGWAVLGLNDLAEKALKAADSDMGDLSIRGDTQQYFFLGPQDGGAPADQPTQQPVATTPPSTKNGGWLKPLLLGAALAGTGAGGYATYDYFSQTTPAPASTQPAKEGDWKLGIDVRDRP